jgi:lipopolysaccharide transport system permease protein
MASDFSNALADLGAAMRMRRVWIALAHEDIGDQHRRTALGPVWLLLNYLAFAATFIFVFRGGGGEPGYVSYVATGLFIWFYIMEVINQSTALFTREESMIKGTVLPLSIYVMRQTAQSVIRSGYALAGCVVLLLLAGNPLPLGSLWAVPGIVVMIAVTPAVTTIVAFAGAFFPDSAYIINNLMRIGMFLTPVFWTYDSTMGIRHILYYWNPFTYFIEVVRVPILTGNLPVVTLAFCCGVGILCWVLALFLLGRYRKRLAFIL